MSETHWTNAAVTLSTPQCLSPRITDNAQDLAVAFSGKKMLQLPQGSGPLFQMHSLVFEAQVHLDPDKKVVGFVTELTHGYGKSAGTRIALLADIAGSNESLEYDFAAVGTPDPLEPLVLHRWFSPQGLHHSGAGQSGTSGPVVHYRLALMVTIQRETTDDSGHFFLDGLDVFPVVS